MTIQSAGHDMDKEGNYRIVASADDLVEGLFGQVFLFIAEILPYLSARGLRPDWDIDSRYYGKVIPGTLDLAYRPAAASHDLPLSALRDRHRTRLEGDWTRVSALWNQYFVVPPRIVAQADAIGHLGATLGVHYRGTDKLTACWDTNPVRHSDFAAIIRDWLARRPDLTQVFVATDDPDFTTYLAGVIDRPIVNLGQVGFHKGTNATGDTAEANAAKADRALVDCVILSRCRAVLKTSSALSAFAKVLQPDLEIYRCAASKLFADIPYFPVAYVPVYQTEDATVAAILQRLMAGDWREDAQTRMTSRRRWQRLRAIARRYGRIRALLTAKR